MVCACDIIVINSNDNVNKIFLILCQYFSCTFLFYFLPFTVIFLIYAIDFCYLPIAHSENFFHRKIDGSFYYFNGKGEMQPSISTSLAMNSTSCSVSNFARSSVLLTTSKLLYEKLMFGRNDSILFK